MICFCKVKIVPILRAKKILEVTKRKMMDMSNEKGETIRMLLRVGPQIGVKMEIHGPF